MLPVGHLVHSNPLKSKPLPFDSVLIPFHLPARPWIHFCNSKLLFWFLRIGLPKCGCRISWFIWIVWFVAISSINSSLGLGHHGRKVSERICESLCSLRIRWQLDSGSRHKETFTILWGQSRYHDKNIGSTWPSGWPDLAGSRRMILSLAKWAECWVHCQGAKDHCEGACSIRRETEREGDAFWILFTWG